MKRCALCKIEKELNCFGPSKQHKDGKRPHCKECRKLEHQNPDRKREWYLKNRELTIERVKNWQSERREFRRSYTRKHYQENKDIYKKRTVLWQKTHPHVVAWRRLLTGALYRLQQDKTSSTFDMLGYSAEELKNHIESLWTPEMTWQNYGEWHIDHIQPLNSFDCNTDVKVVNALSNLRPLWATDRIIDGIFYEGNLNRTKKWTGN